MEDVAAILNISLFRLKLLIYCTGLKYTFLKFQHYNKSSRFEAKEFSFTVTFIINILFIKINQKNIMQTAKGNNVLVRIG